LPKDSWIGGAAANFITADGGVTDQAHVPGDRHHRLCRIDGKAANLARFITDQASTPNCPSSPTSTAR
jgi:hypothetical protein